MKKKKGRKDEVRRENKRLSREIEHLKLKNKILESKSKFFKEKLTTVEDDKKEIGKQTKAYQNERKRFFKEWNSSSDEDDDEKDEEKRNLKSGSELVKSVSWGENYVLPELRNQGNTDYINTSLQVLFRIPSFVKQLWELFQSNGMGKKKKKKNIPIVEYLGNLIFSNQKKVKEKNLKRLIKYVSKKKIGAKYGARKHPHEFISNLLEHLHEKAGVQIKGLEWKFGDYCYCTNCNLFKKDHEEADREYFHTFTPGGNLKFRDRMRKVTGLPLEDENCELCKKESLYISEIIIEFPRTGLILIDWSSSGSHEGCEMSLEEKFSVPKFKKGSDFLRPRVTYELVSAIIEESNDNAPFSDDINFTSTIVRNDNNQWFHVSDNVVNKVTWSHIEKFLLGKPAKHGNRCVLACYQKLDDKTKEYSSPLKLTNALQNEKNVKEEEEKKRKNEQKKICEYEEKFNAMKEKYDDLLKRNEKLEKKNSKMKEKCKKQVASYNEIVDEYNEAMDKIEKMKKKHKSEIQRWKTKLKRQSKSWKYANSSSEEEEEEEGEEDDMEEEEDD